MKTNSTEWLWHIFLGTVVLGLLFPLLWMVSLSLKTTGQISLQNPLDLWPAPWTWENFAYVLFTSDFGRYTWNTFVIAAAVTVGKVATSLLAAYGFTQFHFPGRGMLYYGCVFSMFIPFVSIMMPNYLLLAKLGWLNTYWAAIVPHIADGMGIFLLRQSIRSIPRAVLDSARMDGFSHWKILTKIVVPLIKPAMVALAILSFVNSWNEYFWPMLVMNQKSMYTLPVALSMFANVEGGTEWGAMMAAATLTALPPLLCYLLARRHIVETFLHSGVKG